MTILGHLPSEKEVALFIIKEGYNLGLWEKTWNPSPKKDMMVFMQSKVKSIRKLDKQKEIEKKTFEELQSMYRN